MIFQNIFCQEYHFNRFLEYKDTKHNFIDVYLINTKDNSYSLELRTVYGKDSIYGVISDYKREIKHQYKVINIKDTIQFNYMNSIKNYYHSYYVSKKLIEESKKEIDSTTKEIEILIYRNKRKKKVDWKINLLIKNSEDSLPMNILGSFTRHERLLNKDINIKTGIILNMLIENSDGEKHEIKLINHSEINTMLSNK